MLSLMANDDDRVEETTDRLTDDHYQRLMRDHDDIERDSQAVLTFNPDERTVSLQGLRPSVHMAQAMLHRKLSPMGTPFSGGSSSSSGHHLVVAVKSTLSEDDDRGMLHTQSFSPGAESSHDSCYDSDGSPSASRRSSSANLNANSHDDVSRTVSDTLAAEHADDVLPSSSSSTNTPPKHKLLSPTSSLPASIEGTRKKSHPQISSKSSSETHLQQTTKVQVQTSNSRSRNATSKHLNLGATSTVVDVKTTEQLLDSSATTTATTTTANQDSKVSSPETDSSEEFAQSAEYTPKAEFALKLGYSEEQLREVLHKCGRDLSQNELLSELIKLGSSAGSGPSGRTGMDTDDVDFEESYEDGSDMFEAVGNSSNAGAELVYDQTAVDLSGLSISSSNSKSTTGTTVTVVEEPVEDGGNAFLSALLGSAKPHESKSGSSGPGKDESNLRQIVIDGSNLAMR